MRKTPSYLKGLAETRARAAGEVARYAAIIEEVQEKLASSRAELEACDKLIRRFDERLDPTEIEPVRAWQGRFGKRGALREALVRYVKEAHPNSISTTELAIRAQVEFRLDFGTPNQRRTWVHDSVGGALKVLAARDVIERLHDPRVNSGMTGYWRWVAATQTLDGLSQLAATAGASVVEGAEAPTEDGFEVGPAVEECDDLPC